MSNEVAVRKRGGQRKNPPAKAAALILELASSGYTKKGIAYRLGCKLEVFNRWLSEQEDLQTAFDEGREREHKALFTMLYEKAMAGDTVSALFLLKTRHGYREGDQSDQANRVAITFNLPGAMPLQDFIAIHDTANDRPQSLPTARSIDTRRA